MPEIGPEPTNRVRLEQVSVNGRPLVRFVESEDVDEDDAETLVAACYPQPVVEDEV